MSCTLCPLHEKATNILIPFRGTYNRPKILFVGSAPSAQDDVQNQNFSSTSGDLLREVLQEVGVPLDQVSYDNVVHCVPRDLQGMVRDPEPDEVLSCAPYLWNAIKYSNPEVIVALGTTAWREVTGNKADFITDVRGLAEPVSIAGKIRKVIGTFNPMAAIRQQKARGPGRYMTSIADDIRYAWDHALGNYYLPKWRCINDTQGAIAYIEALVKLYQTGQIQFAALDTETPQLILKTSDRRELGIEMISRDLWMPDKKFLGFSLSYIPPGAQHFREVEGVYIPLAHPESKVDYTLLGHVIRWAFDEMGEVKIPLAFHNHKYDAQWLMEKYDTTPVHYHDTMLGSFIYHGTSIKHGLGNLSHKLLKYEIFKDDTEELLAALPMNQRSFYYLPLKNLARRGAIDAAATASLALLERDMLNKSGQMQVTDILNEGSVAFAEMEHRGACIDHDKWRHHMERYPKLMDEAREKVMNLPLVKLYIQDRKTLWTKDKKGKYRPPDPKFQFNPNSADHKNELMYQYYMLPLEYADEADSSTEDVEVYSTGENSRHLMTLHCRDEKYKGECTCRTHVPGWDATVQTYFNGTPVEVRDFRYHHPVNYQQYNIDPHPECYEFLINIRFWSKLRKVYNDYLKKIERYFRPDDWHAKHEIPSNLRIIDFNYLLHWVKTGRLSTRDYPIHTQPWHCWKSGTKVRLLDGSEPTILELYNKYKDGGEFWVYSVDDETGRVVPGRAHSPAITGRDVPTVEVVLDNDQVLVCTPEHLFRTRNRGYVEAQNLTSDDSLSPLYLKDDGNGYEMLYDLASGQFVYTHQRVNDEANGPCPAGWVRHHVDFDKTNNDPRNLMPVSYGDHTRIHSLNWQETIGKPEVRAKNSEVLRDLMLDQSYKDRVVRGFLTYAQSTENKDRLIKMNKSQAGRERVSALHKERKVGWGRYYRDNLDAKEKNQAARCRIILDFMLTEGLDIDKRDYDFARKVVSIKSPSFDTACKLLNLNHRVVSVTSGSRLSEVYDFTVDRYHNFALASGVFVHNSDPRRLFVSRWKNTGGLMLSADYSQLEVRVAAALGKDEKLIQLYRDGADVHRATAAQVYQVPPEAVTQAMRRYSKTMTFRLIYGGGANAIADETGLTKKEAQVMIDGFLAHYTGVDGFIKYEHNFVQKFGYVLTALNRKFYLPDIYSDDKGKRAGALRDSQNYTIQSPSSDVTMTAILIVRRYLRLQKMLSYIWAMVHDAVESDLYPGELLKYHQVLKSAMEVDVVKIFSDWLCVPMVAEFELGVRWDGSLVVKELDENHMILSGRKGFWEETADHMQRGYKFKYKIKKEMLVGTHKTSSDVKASCCGGIEHPSMKCVKCGVIVPPEAVDLGETLILRKSYEGEAGGNVEVVVEVEWEQKFDMGV